MQLNKEVKAVINLLDDPDTEVFSAISNKLLDYGNSVIPFLENEWENNFNSTVQQRIEAIIHKIHFNDLQKDLIDWSSNSYNDLLFGSLLVAKYQYPELQTAPVLQQLDKIKKNIWLELNNYLTPLEQANVMCNILYNYYKLTSNDVTYENANDFFINKVLETKTGNAISMGILYQIMCDLLDINASIISVPRQMIIAYYHSDYYADKSNADAREHIHFYVDAVNGQAYSYNDLIKYFRRIEVQPTAEHFKPLSHKKAIKILLEEIGKCFISKKLDDKQEEIVALAKILDK